MSGPMRAPARGRSEPPTLRRDVLARTWLTLRGLSQAGDAVWTIGLAWTAVHLASPAAAGAVVAAGTLPRAAALLFGGVIADRYDTRGVLILANAARIVVLVLVGVRVATGPPSLGVLLAAAVAFGVCDAVHEPAAGTVARQLVRTSDLTAYSGMSLTMLNLGAMGGAAVGGFVVAAWGLGGSAAIDVATFAVVLVFLVWWLVPRYPLARTEPEPVLRSIRGGFAHLAEEPLTRTLMIALSGLNVFVGPVEGIGLALRARAEGWGAASVGLLLALLGAGAVLGALATAWWRPGHGARVAFGGLIVQGLAIVVMGSGPQWLTALACAVVGVTSGVASVLLSAVFQATVDGAYLGRMSALQRLGDDVLMPVAMTGFGALASVAGVGTAFTAYGVAMAVLMVWPLANPALRRLSLG